MWLDYFGLLGYLLMKFKRNIGGGKMSLDIEQYTQEHQATWETFIKLSIYGTVGVIAILVLMAIFLL